MAIFHNCNTSRICLTKHCGQYGLVLKSLKIGETSQEQAYLRRTPRVIETCIEGFAAKVGEESVIFEEPVPLVDFSKFIPVEESGVICQPGEYSFDRITVILGNREASVVVLPGTTLGIFKAGLESIVRRQKYGQIARDKLTVVTHLVAEHFGLEPKDVPPSFVLKYVNGLGSVIGSGPYRSLRVKSYPNPATIIAGITVQEIVNQL